jgi:serine protease AprX
VTNITINGISIDPTAPRRTLAALSLDNATAKNSDYIIVQVKQPLDKAQRKALAKAGADIIESVPGDAYVCHFPKTDLAKVRALPFVAWADLYPKAVKIAPSLRNVEARPGGLTAAIAVMDAVGKLDATRKTVDVVLHRNVDTKKAAKHIAEAAHLTPAQVAVLRGKVRLVVKQRRLDDLAALDEVRHSKKSCPANYSIRSHGKCCACPAAPHRPAARGRARSWRWPTRASTRVR